MAFSNDMTKLLNKVERRLQLRVLEPQLKKLRLGKSDWVEPIKEDSLPTFSRFFPVMIPYKVDRFAAHDDDGWYIIDEELVDNQKIIGVADIDFNSFTQDSLIHMQNMGYGFANYQALQAGFAMEDVASVQMAADVSSLFSQGMYLEFKEPNKFKIVSSTNMNVSMGLRTYYINILVSHQDNLLTIPPSQMETFEKLVFADVANFLYGNLKYYDGLETLSASIDLKMDELSKWADTREEIVQLLDDAHVSTANNSCPIMMTIY